MLSMNKKLSINEIKSYLSKYYFISSDYNFFNDNKLLEKLQKLSNLESISQKRRRVLYIWWKFRLIMSHRFSWLLYWLRSFAKNYRRKDWKKLALRKRIKPLNRIIVKPFLEDNKRFFKAHKFCLNERLNNFLFNNYDNFFLLWEKRRKDYKKRLIFLKKFLKRIKKYRRLKKLIRYRRRGLYFVRRKKFIKRKRRLKLWRKWKTFTKYPIWGKQFLMISLTQLVKMNIHIGHSFNDYCFLSSWMFKAWWKDIYLMNMYKTQFSWRQALAIYRKSVFLRRPIWFVCLDKDYGSLLARYAFMCGQAFSNAIWINGFLTNFRRIISWNKVITHYMVKNEYDLRFRDKKRLVASYGVLYLSRRRVPPLSTFVVRVLESLNVVNEFFVARVASVAIIDSNVPSWNTVIPVAGNDDSLACVNFYLYLITKYVLLISVNRIRRLYKRRIVNINRKRNFKKFLNLYFTGIIDRKYLSFFDLLMNLNSPILYVNRRTHESSIASMNTFFSTLTIQKPFFFNFGHFTDKILPKFEKSYIFYNL